MSNTSAPLISYSAAEAAAAINYSRMFLLGNALTILAYGILVTLFAVIIPLAWTKMGPTTSTSRRRPYGTLAFVTVLFLLNTLYLISTILMLESAYIDNADFPGGFFAYLAFSPGQPIAVVNQVSCVIGIFLADAFLLIRTRAIFRAVGGKYPQLLLIPGVILVILSTVLSILYSVDLISPDGIFGTQTTYRGNLYFIISFVDNAYLTLLITLRIWIYQRGANRALGGSGGYGQFYATFCVMFIESAALYSVVALGSVVTYNNPMTMVWQSLALPVQTIASFLITYRIARGRAWEVSAINTTIGEARVRVRVDENVVIKIGESQNTEKSWV